MGLWASFQKGKVSTRTQTHPEVKAGGESTGDAPAPRFGPAIEETLRPPRPAPEASLRAVGFFLFEKRPTGPSTKPKRGFWGAKLEGVICRE